MESVPDITYEYPITLKFFLNYGVRGRYYSGPFKDMIDKFHDIDRLTDARQLLQDLQAPLQFKSLMNAFRGVIAWLVIILIISILYLIYIFVITQDLQQGLQVQFLYYLLLLVLFSLQWLTYVLMNRKFEKELNDHINFLNKTYQPRGIELKAEHQLCGWKGRTILSVTRFKEQPAETSSSAPKSLDEF